MFTIICHKLSAFIDRQTLVDSLPQCDAVTQFPESNGQAMHLPSTNTNAYMAHDSSTQSHPGGMDISAEEIQDKFNCLKILLCPVFCCF